MTLLKRNTPSPPAANPEKQAWPDRAAFETASVLAEELRARIQGEVRFDRVSRSLYGTDASNYQIDPIGVVMPRSQDDVIGAMELAASYGIPILPRGGGSSLAGQAVGAALVIDTSRHLTRVLDVNRDEQTVTVEPGIYLADLNRHLAQHHLMFGPDPSSANRATIGGVLANNATGAHSILYGMAADHLVSTRIQTATNQTLELGPASMDEHLARIASKAPGSALIQQLLDFRTANAELIKARFPKHWRRASGYGLDQFLTDDDAFNPARLLAGSEGTLATMLSATLKLVAVPPVTGLVLLQFDDLVTAMEAVPVILEANPSAIELLDRMLISLCRATPGYGSQLTFIDGDPAGVLVVEFYGDATLTLRRTMTDFVGKIASRVGANAEPVVVYDEADQRKVWNVRKAGLGILMSVRGDAKPVPVIEDIAVPVQHLPAYVRAVQEMAGRHHTDVAIYAHASAGCLHVRPLINMKTAEGVQTMMALAEEATGLVQRFGGVLSGEHGDGLQRSALSEQVFGPELMSAMRDLKAIFDPAGLMNPGKMINAPSPTEHLRYGPTYAPVQISTNLDFSRDGGFLGAVEMCNGSAVCRTSFSGTMCPSYQATRDEADSTRGRANALRNALASRLLSPDDFADDPTMDVLDLCLSCKACKTECPSSVDMAKIKTEMLAQYYRTHRMPLRVQMMGHFHRVSSTLRPIAPVVNAVMSTPVAGLVKTALGVHPQRTMPRFHSRTFLNEWDAWRKRHPVPPGRRGKVVFFHDTYVTFNHPRVGVAAVRLLEAAGFEVIVERRRVCCGRTMLSKGLVDAARRHARRNVHVLAPYAQDGIPIVGTDPSCMFAFRDEYLDLLPDDADAQLLAKNVFMMDEFLARLDVRGELGIPWKTNTGPEVFFHAHCHQKALIGTDASMHMLRVSGCRPTESGAGCCGMAGSFGYEVGHYDISKKIGELRLLPALNATPMNVTVAVTGISCGQQIEDFAYRPAVNIVEVLAERIDDRRSWQPTGKSGGEAVTPVSQDEAFVKHQHEIGATN